MSHTPLNLFFNGKMAVCLFFVLSGFVLSHTYFATQNTDLVRSSAMRRYVRLSLPVLASSFFVYVLLLVDGFFYNDIASITYATLGTDYDTMNTSFFVFLKDTLYTTFFHKEMYNPVLWTMRYELLGSFLIFSFLALFGNLPKRWLVYLLLVVLFFNTYYFAFIIGMIMADLYRHAPHVLEKSQKWYIHIPIFIIGILLASFPYVSAKGTIYDIFIFEKAWFNYHSVYHIIGGAMLIWALLTNRIGQIIFSTKPLLYIGRLSFSLYLVHFTLLCSFSAYVFKILQANMSYNMSALITFLVSIPITWICAHLLYKLVERHAVTFARKVENILIKSKSQ